MQECLHLNKISQKIMGALKISQKNMGALLKDSMLSLCNARIFAFEQNIPERHRQYGCFAQRFNVFPMQCKNVCIWTKYPRKSWVLWKYPRKIWVLCLKIQFCPYAMQEFLHLNKISQNVIGNMDALLKDSMLSLCNARMFAFEQNISEHHRQYGCFAQRFNVVPMQCKNVCIWTKYPRTS